MDLKEKYRPKSFDSPYLIQTQEVLRVKEMVKDLPHLLLSGPPGCGKSTLACYIIPREMYEEEWRSNTLILNMSDETSVETIRGKVKDFARSQTLDGQKRLIVLDEAEYMSPNAQNALRAMMEQYSSNAVFILTCNNELKIINPLKDDSRDGSGRCLHIRFQNPPKEEVLVYMNRILGTEGITVAPDAFNAMVRLCNGKVRYFLNLLQANAGKKEITLRDLVVPFDGTDIVFDLITKGEVRQAVEEALKVPPHQLVSELCDIIYDLEKFDGHEVGRERIPLLAIVAEHDYRMSLGTDVTIQVRNLVYSLADKLWTPPEGLDGGEP